MFDNNRFGAVIDSTTRGKRKIVRGSHMQNFMSASRNPRNSTDVRGSLDVRQKSNNALIGADGVQISLGDNQAARGTRSSMRTVKKAAFTL